MDDLVFLKLVIRDFKAFKGTHVIWLERETGLWFVRGRNEAEPTLDPNGVGKSTLWDAITWCLYGSTVQGQKNPAVKPWKVKRTTRVGLLIERNGKHYGIHRAANPNELSINKNATEYAANQDSVVKLIGLNYETFTNTVILGQGRDLFFDMSPGAKLQLLSDVKELDRWDERSKRASKAAREMELTLAELDGEQIATTEIIETGKLTIKKLEPKAIAYRDEIADRLEKDAKLLKTIQPKLDKLQREADGYSLKYDSAMTEVKACEQQVAKLSGEVSDAKSALLTIRCRRENLIDDLEKAEVDLRTSWKRCPTCGQTVGHKDLDKHRDEVRASIREKEAILAKLSTKRAKNVLKVAEQRLATEQSHLAAFHAKADGAIQSQEKLFSSLASYKETLRVIRQRKAEAERKTDPYTEQLRELRANVRRQEAQLREIKLDHAWFTARLERTRFWVKGFRDVKLHIIEELLQELELTATGMLEDVGLIGWKIAYEIERETKKGTVSRGLTVLIGSPSSEGLVAWESWSGGEKQRLRMIGALSLSQVLLSHAGVNPSIEVLDEPTQHLSDGGVHDLIDTLAERAKDTGRIIFYSDHQSVDSTRFAGTLLVARDRAGAWVARGGGRPPPGGR
jgi:DNA repair exonuclease SbcCD ATPase subunit